VAFGSGIGSIEDTASTAITLSSKGYRGVSPFFVPRILSNMAAGHISIKYGFQGPNHAVATACATGAHAIGDAFRFVKYGDADCMLAGASESSINAITFAGFSKLRGLSTAFNDGPAKASRPFDVDRDGFVLGEGAGCVVLEELESARARGAKIYAEVRGYGLSGDANHITAPHESGRGAVAAMEASLAEAGCTIHDVGYVNAHATSTPLGDEIEANAIAQVFADAGVPVAVSSTKGATGHLLGAAGTVEAIFAVLALENVSDTAAVETYESVAIYLLCSSFRVFLTEPVAAVD
jgi:3-oxoacyl-[acyl-carrier-protein] synthase II